MEKRVITLISDWGWDDVSLGMLKWELNKRFPDAYIVDLTHEVELLDVGQTAFIMSRLYQRFPVGSVHLILTGVSRWMLDPFLMVEEDEHFFIGIDNGVLPTMFPNGMLHVRRLGGDGSDRLLQMVHLTEACITGCCEREMEEVQQVEKGFQLRYVYSEQNRELRGHVMYVDRHHNVVTNIPVDLFRQILGDQSFELVASGFKIRRYHERYEKECEPYLVPNALGVLEIVSYGARIVIMPRWYRDQEIVINFYN